MRKNSGWLNVRVNSEAVGFRMDLELSGCWAEPLGGWSSRWKAPGKPIFFIYHFTNNSFVSGFQIWGLLNFMMLLQSTDKGKVAGSEGSVVLCVGNQWL